MICSNINYRIGYFKNILHATYVLQLSVMSMQIAKRDSGVSLIEDIQEYLDKVLCCVL